MPRPNESPLKRVSRPSAPARGTRRTDHTGGRVGRRITGPRRRVRIASADRDSSRERERSDGANPRPASAGARYLGRPGIREREFYAARGRHTVKRVPFPFWLCTAMLPWQSSMYRFVSVSPRPTPSCCRLKPITPAPLFHGSVPLSAALSVPGWWRGVLRVRRFCR